jgi:succinoglycan biosynthesis transport protein ExoP
MINENSLPIGNKEKNEFGFGDLIQIISRRKNILILSILALLVLAIVYNIFKKPVYESYAIIKKERTTDRSNADDIREMFAMQTMDDLETEIEIIKTSTVLEKVISELNFTLTIKKAEFIDGEIQEINASFFDYNNYLNTRGYNYNKLPQFLIVEQDYSFAGSDFYIQKSIDGGFEIFKDEGNRLFESFVETSIVELDQSGIRLTFEWPGSRVGEKVYFTIESLEKSIKNIQSMISISGIGKTNLVKVTVESESSQLSQKMTETIVEKFRDVRLEQKRQTVLYSFEFVNNQVKDIEQKLENSEIELSKFKSDNKIIIIDESSKEIINFLSGLEGEKIQVELELGEYENKQNEMKKEHSDKGYFDQTYLTPQRSDGRESPFSALLEQLSDMEIQRLVLLQKRKENHPDVITVNEQIAQIKSKLSEYNQNTLTSYNILIKTLRKKRANLNRLIERYSDKIEKLPDQESDLVKLTRNRNVYEKMFSLLLDKREEFRLAELSKLQDIVIIEPAQIALKPVRPRKALNIALALLTGLFIGMSIIVVKEIFEKKITTLDDIEKLYSYPLLTIIPKYSKKLAKKINNASSYEDRLVSLMDDESGFKEYYRLLGIKLRNFSLNGTKALLISSCEENTGKTSIATNLAISLARKGEKVLIIDGDLRKAAISKIFNDSSKSPGLIKMLTKDINLSHVLKHLHFEKKSKIMIDYIPAGGSTENSGEILDSEKMKKIIEEVSPAYDHILIDTPPITRLVDTLVIGKFVKDLILVIKPHHTYRDSLALAIEELEQSNINILGYIINAGDISQLSQKYKYGYGYGYGYPTKEEKTT